MNYRSLGNTDLKVSEISFGTWGIGGSWGKTDDQESLSYEPFRPVYAGLGVCQEYARCAGDCSAAGAHGWNISK
jgi:hypothetical protein